MFKAKVVEKIKTGNLRSTYFSESRAVYEIRGKKVIDPE